MTRVLAILLSLSVTSATDVQKDARAERVCRPISTQALGSFPSRALWEQQALAGRGTAYLRKAANFFAFFRQFSHLHNAHAPLPLAPQNRRISLDAHNGVVFGALNSFPGKKVVDFGTGDGLFLINYARQHPSHKIIGIERGSADWSRGLQNVGYVDAHHTPIASNSVDLVTIHYPYLEQDAIDMFSEAWRILQPGGTLRVVTDGPRREAVTDFSTYIPPRRQEMVRAMTEMGFDVKGNGIPLLEIDPEYPRTSQMSYAISLSEVPLVYWGIKPPDESRRQNSSFHSVAILLQGLFFVGISSYWVGLPDLASTLRQVASWDEAREIYVGPFAPFTHMTSHKFIVEYSGWIKRQYGRAPTPEEHDRIARFATLIGDNESLERGGVETFNQIRRDLERTANFPRLCEEACRRVLALATKSGFQAIWKRQYHGLRTHSYILFKVIDADPVVVDLVADQFENPSRNGRHPARGVVIVPRQLVQEWAERFPWYTRWWPFTIHFPTAPKSSPIPRRLRQTSS